MSLLRQIRKSLGASREIALAEHLKRDELGGPQIFAGSGISSKRRSVLLESQEVRFARAPEDGWHVFFPLDFSQEPRSFFCFLLLKVFVRSFEETSFGAESSHGVVEVFEGVVALW